MEEHPKLFSSIHVTKTSTFSILQNFIARFPASTGPARSVQALQKDERNSSGARVAVFEGGSLLHVL